MALSGGLQDELQPLLRPGLEEQANSIKPGFASAVQDMGASNMDPAGIEGVVEHLEEDKDFRIKENARPTPQIAEFMNDDAANLAAFERDVGTGDFTKLNWVQRLMGSAHIGFMKGQTVTELNDLGFLLSISEDGEDEDINRKIKILKEKRHPEIIHGGFGSSWIEAAAKQIPQVIGAVESTVMTDGYRDFTKALSTERVPVFKTILANSYILRQLKGGDYLKMIEEEGTTHEAADLASSVSAALNLGLELGQTAGYAFGSSLTFKFLGYIKKQALKSTPVSKLSTKGKMLSDELIRKLSLEWAKKYIGGGGAIVIGAAGTGVGEGVIESAQELISTFAEHRIARGETTVDSLKATFSSETLHNVGLAFEEAGKAGFVLGGLGHVVTGRTTSIKANTGEIPDSDLEPSTEAVVDKVSAIQSDEETPPLGKVIKAINTKQQVSDAMDARSELNVHDDDQGIADNLTKKVTQDNRAIYVPPDKAEVEFQKFRESGEISPDTTLWEFYGVTEEVYDYHKKHGILLPIDRAAMFNKMAAIKKTRPDGKKLQEIIARFVQDNESDLVYGELFPQDQPEKGTNEGETAEEDVEPEVELEEAINNEKEIVKDFATKLKEQILEKFPKRGADTVEYRGDASTFVVDMVLTSFKHLANRANVSISEFINDWSFDVVQGKVDGGGFGSFSLENKTITLSEEAGVDTLIHELGHLFIRMLEHYQDKNPDFRADVDALNEHYGNINNLNNREKMTQDLTKYTIEGKLPTNKLRRAFRYVKLFMVDAYKYLSFTQPDIPKSVRDVFDNLFEAEVLVAGYESLNRNVETYIVEHILANHKRVSEDLRNIAQDEATFRKEAFVKDVEKALRAKKRKKRAAFKKDPRNVNPIKNKIGRLPKFRAHYALRGNKRRTAKGLISAGYAQIPKFDEADLFKHYPQDYAHLKKRGYVSKNGLPADVLADMFGFQNPFEMIIQLNEDIDFDALVEAEIEKNNKVKITKDEHNEIIEEVARKHVRELTKAQNDLILQEYPWIKAKVVRDLGRRPKVLSKVKVKALDWLRHRPISLINPNVYAVGTDRAKKRVADEFNRGNIKKAIDAIGSMDINYSYRVASKELKTEIDKLFKRLDKVVKLDPTKEGDNYDYKYLTAAQALAQAIGYTEGKVDINDITSIVNDPYDTMGPLIEDAFKQAKNYRNMTYNEFEAMGDFIVQLKNLAHNVKHVHMEHGKAKLKDILNEITKASENVDSDFFAVTNNLGLKNNPKAVSALFARPAVFFKYMDDFNSDNVFNKYLVLPYHNPYVAYTREMEGVFEQYRDLVNNNEINFKENINVVVEAGSIPNLTNVTMLLNFMKHVKANPKELAAAYGTTPEVLVSEYQRLKDEGIITEAFEQYNQGVFDTMSALKDRYYRTVYDVKGYKPRDVAGDYFTIIRDGEELHGLGMDIVNFDDQGEPVIGSNASVINKAPDSTSLSRTNSNLKFDLESNNDLKLIENRIRYIHLARPHDQITKIVRSPEFKNAVGPAPAKHIIIPYVNAVITQKSDSGGWLAKQSKTARRGAYINYMLFNSVNALSQLTGNFPAAKHVGFKNWFASVRAYYMNKPGALRLMHKHSTLVSAQSDALLTDVHTILDRESMRSLSWYGKAKDISSRFASSWSKNTQLWVNRILWLAQFHKSIQEGKTELEAAVDAENAIIITQGTGTPHHLSAVERGPALTKLFSQFQNYMLTVGNGVVYDAMRKQVGHDATSDFFNRVTSMTFRLIIPTLLTLYIRHRTSKPLKKDEDRGIFGHLRDFFGGLLGNVPFIGSSLESLTSGKYRTNSILESAALATYLKAGEGTVHILEDVWAGTQGEGFDVRGKDVTNVARGVTMFTGVAFGPIIDRITTGLATYKNLKDKDDLHRFLLSIFAFVTNVKKYT